MVCWALKGEREATGSDVEIDARKARLCAKQFACPVIGSNPALGLPLVTCVAWFMFTASVLIF